MSDRLRLWTLYALVVGVTAWITYTWATAGAAWLAGAIH